MSCLGMFRRMSDVFACLSVRQGSGDDSTDRWQDKSREVRPGRSGEERRQIKHFARGATKRDSLSIRATAWNINTTCTSRASTT
jgi:hypothetical protein